MGFGCKICGTGYAVKADVFCEILNDARESSLAKDLEYTMLLAIKNIKVAFAEKAVVYDEKPSEGFRLTKTENPMGAGCCGCSRAIWI